MALVLLPAPAAPLPPGRQAGPSQVWAGLGERGAAGLGPSTSGLWAPGPGQPGAGLGAWALRTTVHAGCCLGGPRRGLSFPGRVEAQFHNFTAQAPCRECPWGPRGARGLRSGGAGRSGSTPCCSTSGRTGSP